MGLIECRFYSHVLQVHTALTITLPDLEVAQDMAAGRLVFPVMYVLHGGTEDGSIWMRQTHLEQIGQQKGFMTVSFDAMSSAYADMVHGGAYFTFMTDELPRFVETMFPASDQREDRFIAGFSMGGQGALKAAFRCPERYAAALGISGARDMLRLFEQWENMDGGPDMSGVRNALGPIANVRGGDNDIVYLARAMARKKESLPLLFLACAASDYAVEHSVAYHELLNELGIPHTFYQCPGVHDYAFVDQALRYAVDHFIPIRSRRIEEAMA